MIEIVGIFRGQFVRGRFSMRDMEDLAAMKLLTDDFTGAVWGVQAVAARFSMKICRQAKSEPLQICAQANMPSETNQRWKK